MRSKHLMKRDTPTRAVIAPESNDMRRLLLLPSLGLRAVLFFKRERRVNVYDVFRSPLKGRTTLVPFGYWISIFLGGPLTPFRVGT